MKIKIKTDSDTLKVLEIASDFLVKYFNHNKIEAIKLIENYYKETKSYHDDDFYHHESSYRVAIIVHYFAFLKGDFEHFNEWIESNGLNNTPDEALEYFNKNYFL